MIINISFSWLVQKCIFIRSSIVRWVTVIHETCEINSFALLSEVNFKVPASLARTIASFYVPFFSSSDYLNYTPLIRIMCPANADHSFNQFSYEPRFY